MRKRIFAVGVIPVTERVLELVDEPPAAEITAVGALFPSYEVDEAPVAEKGHVAFELPAKVSSEDQLAPPSVLISILTLSPLSAPCARVPNEKDATRTLSETLV
ncbi:hypothetical protein MUN81_14210 [Hymenobacter sp. 5317J-9]|uniref:hypothetical protein n=1 Tax=Hymenobacter sp. 5317J-9 TaxID=2932250 RepID=UPI001FD6DBE3|nr:hypothetical protein [Hymenobacter sp. 5317J-9]UOQ96398.1 hypothetical protein MUN81_14210 [Hymenobacter sp. 5317J-9]